MRNKTSRHEKKTMPVGSEVNLHHLRYFLAAAEHQNYTHAAGAAGVHASTLSRRVRQLEDDLGVSLFERHRKGIRLTVAGRQFLSRTQRFMFDFERAVTRAAQAGRAELGELCLGVAPSILSGPFQKFINRYRQEVPDVELHCVESDDAGLVLALHERGVDVAVGYADLLHSPGVRSMALWPECLHVALPMNHPLASRQFIMWSHFQHETVIIRGWTSPPQAYKELARRMPDDMQIVPHLVSRDTLLGLVAAGYGLSVVPGSTACVVYPGVGFRPIKEPDAKVTVVAAWLEENDKPVKAKFIAELRKFARNRESKAGDLM